jgi:hypothetical protein
MQLAFWLALLIVLIIAAVPRFATYDFSLPYIDHPDEPNYYLGAREWRGLYDGQGYYDGIPPGYVWVNQLAQLILEPTGTDSLSEHIRVMRFINTFINLATLVVIADLARRTVGGSAGVLAGIVAGLAWGVSPLIIINAPYSTPDPWQYLLTALALWCSARALQPARNAALYAVISTVFAFIAVVLKYPIVPALIPGALAALWLLWRDRKRGLYTLALQAVLVGLVGFWLVFGYGIVFQREGEVVREQGLSNLLNLERLWNNLVYTAVPIGEGVVVAVLLAGILAYTLAKRRIDSGIIILCASLILTIPWLTNTYANVYASNVRYVLPATAALCVVFGAAVGQIALLIPDGQARLRSLLLLPLLVFSFIPQGQGALAVIEDRTRPDSRYALQQWVDASLEPATIIVDNANEKTFNPEWGGLSLSSGRWMDWWIADDMREQTVAEWRARGMGYAVVPEERWLAWQNSADGVAYFADMLYLRAFTDVRYRGPRMVVYRLTRMATEQQAFFADQIRLLGYDANSENVRAGEALRLRFYWQPIGAPPATNYSLFVHVVDSDGNIVAQWDGAPASPDRPTLTWDAQDETLISPEIALGIAADLPAGEYEVRIGIYDFAAGVRLTVEDEAATDNALRLFTIRLS